VLRNTEGLTKGYDTTI